MRNRGKGADIRKGKDLLGLGVPYNNNNDNDDQYHFYSIL